MSEGIGSDMFRLTIQISVKFERYWVKNMQQPVDTAIALNGLQARTKRAPSR
ncbi:3129_t:CDS:2 [Funneliformis mosseae]|uniref:3129_t:CDS:1 n=1 Tax=Funneliformis mosseae TaxID=27381 RepID=A0A9N9BKH3_FUNMO|nr:3129_t:CDS:2 [Funneliformis mosseae]